MKKTYPGLFITFEGIDGCGKSTQAKKLYAVLKRCGFTVSLLREPGGTKPSEKIRRILLDRNLDINPISELFLYEAARAQITREKIIPLLQKRGIVICDRYFDSTTAYQGFGRGLDLAAIDRLNKVAADNLEPDMTFIFDVDYKTSLTRRDKNPDRLEKEKRAFFNRVRKGFLTIAKKKRVVLLNGKLDIDTLYKQVLERTLTALKRKRIVGTR
ncbi:MAG: dTMP kinase [Candidatus Zixiibacteriota bacterium]